MTSLAFASVCLCVRVFMCVPELTAAPAEGAGVYCVRKIRKGEEEEEKKQNTNSKHRSK